MRTIVLSKQCDYDADLFALWTKWYREVFPSDLIIMTPVRVKGNPIGIDETLSWYKDKVDGLEVIELEKWHVEEVWKRQLEILTPHLTPETFWVSADGDQFFDLSTTYLRSNIAVFKRRLLFAHEVVTPENIHRIPLHRITKKSTGKRPLFQDGGGRVCGLKGQKEHKNMFRTGRLLNLNGGSAGGEYHITTRGFEAFAKKARAYPEVVQGDAPKHRRWHEMLRKEGESGLRQQYDAFFRSCTFVEDTKFREFFREAEI